MSLVHDAPGGDLDTEKGSALQSLKEPYSEKQSLEDVSTTVGVPASPTIPELSKIRKVVVLGVLCSAQFFDVFNASASIAALPQVRIPHSTLQHRSTAHRSA